ncbi:MAG: hypothetical protein HYW51_03210 [Candidatus Doudnabacteria bacterium]|nr:hypothetical protein [Candidatus Doudnabacteria bacterium]
MLMEKDAGFWGVEVQNWEKLGKLVVDRIEKGNLDVKQLIKEHQRLGKRLFIICNKLNKRNLNLVSNREIISNLKTIWQDYIELNMLGLIPVISDFEHSILNQRLTGILIKYKVDPIKVQDYLSLLISNNQPDLYWQEQLELLGIARKYKSLRQIVKSQEFKNHVNKYFWLNYGYQGPIWRSSDFIIRLKNLAKSRKSFSKMHTEHKNQFKILVKKQNKLEKQLGLSRKDKYFFATARTFMFLKAYRVNVRHKVHYTSDEIFKALGKRFHLPVKFFQYARREEILDLLKGKKLAIKEISKRQRWLLEITENGISRFIPKSKAKAFLKKMMMPEIQFKGSEIHGQAAYLGIARGPAKLVFGIGDLDKVKRGDILIGVSTTPDLLPAMYKALGFVTDVGGITSHAAIVAREMKKPCVIGTKVGTKVFKDGDLVEVDANKGIVRKI